MFVRVNATRIVNVDKIEVMWRTGNKTYVGLSDEEGIEVENEYIVNLYNAFEICNDLKINKHQKIIDNGFNRKEFFDFLKPIK